MGDPARSLIQSNTVIDPRQARMRMGACHEADNTLSLSWKTRKGGGQHSLNNETHRAGVASGIGVRTALSSFGWTMSAANGGYAAWNSP